LILSILEELYMSIPEINISAAQRIIVPSGRDYECCLEALEAEVNINAPRFSDRSLTLEAAGMLYTKVKGKDVPAYISEGFADVGLTGTDVCEEQVPENSNLLYQAIGEPMCTFNLLLPKDQAESMADRLVDADAEPVRVATSYPRFLKNCINRARERGENLNISIEQFKPSGSVEALPGWISEAAADIVETGETAEFNGLDIGYKLADVFPAIVWRDPSKPPEPLNNNFFGVDTALAERVSQVEDPRLNSYTIGRLRNSNQALKDFGEEAAEFLDAAIRGSQTAADELADLIFAGLVLDRSKGGQTRLADVIQILENRNRQTSLLRESNDETV
jgi:ATP phosphoribosyltransferase